MGEAAPAMSSSAASHLKEEVEMDWEAYLGSQRSRTTFAQYYRCSPMSLLGTETAADYDDGNRVVMAPSALDRLGSLKVEYPLVFKIQNAATLQTTHVGVQEFVAEEGFVHVPTHTMARLGLHAADDEDGAGQLVLLTSTSLPKATSIKLQPHTSDFHKVKYPKELLEYNFGRYWCLTVGDTVTVTEGDARYLLDVVEAKPADAVATYETDCEVDFLPPLDYEEPAPARVSAPWTETKVVTVRPGEVATVDFKPPTEMASGRVQQWQRFSGAAVRMDGTTVEAPEEMANSRDQGQFSGVAVRMDGTRVEPPPVEPAAAGPSAKGKRITNGLRFGGAASVPAAGKGGKKADAGEKDKEAGRFTGQTYSMGD